MKKFTILAAILAVLSATSIAVAAETSDLAEAADNYEAALIAAQGTDETTGTIEATGEEETITSVLEEVETAVADTTESVKQIEVVDTIEEKGSPDTGVAGLGAIAGVGIIAAGALLFAGKPRK